MMLRPYSGMFIASSTLTSATSVTAPGDRADIMAAAAQDVHAADHHRRDGLEQIRIAHAERRLAAEANQHDARQRGKQSAQHIERHGDRGDIARPPDSWPARLLPTA